MSKNSVIKLSSNFGFDATEYALEKNAVLGIPNTGKTYTATKIAEGLMDAGIPIIVFDPIGVWKNLKIGNDKNKGYPIVVAGGDETCDIILTAANAKEIVRAAMQERISLVIDFYSKSLIHKATWISVVQSAIEVLLYENRDYGLRHIFIEEAAEFIPQRVQPQHGKVYAAIESVARMGRNSGLGMTLINQRAEEVNKAILELCHTTLLHKQVGKNSLQSIQKWLDVREIPTIKKIMTEIPRLTAGQCYVIGIDEQPKLIQVLLKKTFHPSQSKGIPVKTNLLPVDVSDFVAKMNAILKPIQSPAKKITSFAPSEENFNLSKEIIFQKDQEIKNLKEEINDRVRYELDLKSKFHHVQNAARKAVSDLHSALELLTKIDQMSVDRYVKMGVYVAVKPVGLAPVKNNDHIPIVTDGSNIPNGKSGETRLLQALVSRPDGLTKTRMCAIAGLRPNSGTTSNYFSSLRQKGLISLAGGLYFITIEGDRQAGLRAYHPHPKELLQHWQGIIGEGNGAGRIFSYLTSIYPNGATRAELAEQTDMSEKSGTFSNYLSTLNKYDMMDKKDNKLNLSPEFFG